MQKVRKYSPLVVYGLRDPMVPNLIRYVGQTNRLKSRQREHMNGAGGFGSAVAIWELLLNRCGRRPELFVLGEFGEFMSWSDYSVMAGAFESKLIHSLERHQGYMLNKEGAFVSAAKNKLPISRVWEYRSLARRAVQGSRSALDAVLQMEQDYPNVFHIFKFGDLLSGKTEEPSRSRTRKEAREKAGQGANG